MKTRRTRQYTSTGKRIFSTLNKTSKPITYTNTNPQFVMTCQSRSNNGGRGCTNAGCGDQCCLLSFLVQNITFTDWNNHIKNIGVGQNLQNHNGGGVIGTITELVFPCACCQIPALIGDNSYNNFPLDMRILAKPASGSCANSGYTGPNLFTAQAGDISGQMTTEEAYEVMGTSNVGAPYRNPIKGWRKTLECCLCENYQLTGTFTQTPTNTLIGSTITTPNGFSGIIEDSTYIPGTAFGYSLTIQTTNCPPKNIPSGQATISTQPSPLFTITATKGLGGRTHLVANDIYKDNYSGPKSSESGCCPGGGQARSGIQGRTHHPIIRSGMQPKPNICCSTGKPATRCNRDPNRCIDKNNYAYDYHQYLNNKSLKSFHRSQDKFFMSYPNPNGSGFIQATLGGCCTLQAVGRGCPTIGCQNALYTKGLCRHKCQAAVTRENVTIYKPNNRKFSKQGAVTSSGRLERLKLDTIRTANSKCSKGPPGAPRCRSIVGRNGSSTQTFLAPKGPYLAGRPRFTGQIYNARHPERVCMLRYRQQPFGIPQLTNRRRATRSNRNPPPMRKVTAYFQMITLQKSTQGGWNTVIDGLSGEKFVAAPSSFSSALNFATIPPDVGDTLQQLLQPNAGDPANKNGTMPPGGGFFAWTTGSQSFDPSGAAAGGGSTAPWPQQHQWLKAENALAIGTITNVSVDDPLWHLTVKLTAGEFPQLPSWNVPPENSWMVISKDDKGAEPYLALPAPSTLGGGAVAWTSVVPGASPPLLTYYAAYNTNPWTDVSAPVEEIVGYEPVQVHRQQRVAGVWQRGNTNPRAPACKCVATGTTGCANSACPTCGTGQLAQNPGVPCCT